MIAQILLALAVILILIGLVMILLDAFSESAFWGILVLLFAPVFGPIFAFVHWYKSRARNGFALTFFGMVLLAAGIYGGGVKSIPGLADQEVVKKLPSAIPSDEPLSNEAEATSIKLEEEENGEYDPILSTDKERFSVKEIEPLAPAEDKTLHGTPRPKIKKVVLEVEDINFSIGQNVEVTFKNGTTKRGKVIANTQNSISLEEQVGGGSISFEHKLDKIQSISLLLDPAAAPVPPTVKKKEVLTETVPEAPQESVPETVQAPGVNQSPSEEASSEAKIPVVE